MECYSIDFLSLRYGVFLLVLYFFIAQGFTDLKLVEESRRV